MEPSLPIDRAAERASRVELLFHEALDRAPGERAAWLARACGDDAALAAEVQSLLAADATGGEWQPPSAEELGAALGAVADPWLGQAVGPFVLEHLLGVGGMGRVYLGRRRGEGFEQLAAVKLVRPLAGSAEVLARFSHERATLARLQHPGIARLLDGGATADGAPWLAMEYVAGEPLDAWCAARHLDLAARLRLVAQVADAVAAAHAQLVVHRDLKPSNVLVDAEGRPHLLDFGIARVLDADDGARLTQGESRPMTPAYASPEQVRGEAVGVASDVYSLGVLLFELLTGRLPYELESESATALERAVCEQEPLRASAAVAGVSAATAGIAASSAGDAVAGAAGGSARKRARALRGDLDNILLKALEKEPARRYASAAALADDLRRHLAGQPVLARAPTLHYRAGKFVRRHRAASLLAALLALLAAAAAWQFVSAAARDRQQLEQLLQLADARRLAVLIDELETGLWPPTPDRLPALTAWVSRAEDLLDGRGEHRERLAALDRALAEGGAEQDTLWWREQLASVLAGLEGLAADDAFGATLAAGRGRVGLVAQIEEQSRGTPAGAWAAVSEALGRDERFPTLARAPLAPLWGLAPLRRDPASGLWEFWLVASGERPAVDGNDRLVIDEQSAAVLVLVPGGRCTIGAQAADPAGLHADPEAQADEGPPHEVALDPFLIGKHELTQGQWLRLTGRSPSEQRPDGPTDWAARVSLAHPVEQVSHDDAALWLLRYGLRLPTEAQWEAACRAGAATPWISGASPAGLDRFANLADLHARDDGGSSGWNFAPAEHFLLDDGHTIHAPVGSFAPNAWGLHDFHGNVWEWCADLPAPYGLTETAPGDGRRIIPPEVGELGTRVLRGGCFGNPPERLRSSARWSASRDFSSLTTGVRLARGLGALPAD